MATIDPNIALGVKPLQVENPMAQYAMLSQLQTGQNQNALAQYQLSAAQRADESTNLKNQLYSQHFNQDTGKLDTKAYYNALAKNPVTAGLIPKEQAAQIELEHKANVNQKNIVDTTTAAIKNIREKASDLQFNPSDDNIRAHAQDAVLHGVWTQAQADQNIATAIALPMDQRPTYFAQQGLDAEKRVTTKETNRANLEREKTAKDTLIENTRSHKVHEGISYQTMANASNPELQGKIAGAKKSAEENVKFETQGKIDVLANRKALQQAGYDPITGKDDITELIKKSTGSYLGKAYDIGQRVYGGANEGSVALSQLEQKGNAITFGILNGKLGAGISTSDRQFIESLVSRMSDGTLPVDDRLAAWGSAKNMMKTLGMVDEPKSSTPNVPSSSNSVDTNNILLNPPKKK